MIKRLPLFWKFFLPSLLIALLPLFAVSKYLSYSMERFFIDQTVKNLEEKASLLEDQVKHKILSGDDVSLGILCKKAGKAPGTRFTVILLSGKVAGDSEADPSEMDNHLDRPEVVRAMAGETGVYSRYSKTLHESMIHIAVPLKDGEKLVGILRTSANLKSIAGQLEIIQHHIVFWVLITALMVVGAAFLFSRRLSYPLQKIREGAEYFARGELNYRLPLFASSETKSLAKTMNDMAVRLDERMQTIVRQRKELEAVLSSMGEGVIAISLEETIISANLVAAGMFEHKPSEMANRSIHETIRNQNFHRFVRVALLDEKKHEEDIVFYLKTEAVFNTRSNPLIDAMGKCIGILVVLRDVTRLRRLENMRREFASNVSHEIKTPLTAIKGFAETLRNGALNHPKEAERFVEIIENHANRLIAIVEDLMKLSMIEQKTERKEIEFKKCHLKPVLDSAIQICQAKADEKAIKILLSCDPLIEARLNAALMEQAFVNLLDNAIKYSGPKSKIEINVHETGSETKISFRDHGIGIGKEHFSRVFERFYRVDASRSRRHGGTGLGLAITKHIVNAHSGRITVESVQGEGSIFTIFLYRFS